MSLIHCPECGGQVSDKAAACPHCGFAVASSLQAWQSPPPLPTPVSPIGKFIAVVGSICLFGPLAGFLFTAYTMMHQLTTDMRSATPFHAGSMHRTAAVVLAATAGGLGLGLLGVILVCIAIFVFHFAPSWLRNVLIIGAVFWLPAFPIGTVFAGVLFVILIRNPNAFTRPISAQGQE